MKKFNIRVFVNISMTFFFVSLILSSLILYISPYGRRAFWFNWSFLSLNKGQWVSCHIITGFTFLILGIWHIILNIKPLLTYLTLRAQNAVTHKAEFFAALGLFVLFITGAIFNLTPFSYILKYGSSIQNSWLKDGQLLPISQAELLTLGELTEKLGLNYKAMIIHANEAGLKLDPKKSIKENAEANGLSPVVFFSKVYEGDINREQGRGQGMGEGLGLGKGLGRGRRSP
jgi:hypothetical protein